ncbi:ubiquitin-associated and SH3 domain-containing protein A-like [Corticium candelabrum]|uniref:ubiquitin-associated and SH3 domain-containing protein A-like n=1 Tax=Corticium candelabrum TaxID=121492 RepID=UPI002E25A322|nr:ubiquitin-associated and SH3 domain-containing protein A-like [Corticium candelabrum]
MSACAQTIYIVRHGERLDFVDRLWRRSNPERSYDPPLTDKGLLQAKAVGQEIKSKTLDIKHVISSPFSRCLQTAMCISETLGSQSVGISNGLCEVMNPNCYVTRRVILPTPQLESLNVTLDDSGIDCPLPHFPEQFRDAFHRYASAFEAAADKHWPHNLVLVTHGYGVQRALNLGLSTVAAFQVEYCGYVVLERESKRPQWKLGESVGAS